MVMAWWIWVLIGWATLASLAAFWLAVLVSVARSRELATPSSDRLELPWLAGSAQDRPPMIQVDPKAVAAAARAALLSRSGAAVARLRPRGN
jgi:hypothetical protein